jgi:type IV secretion system protein VirD4
VDLPNFWERPEMSGYLRDVRLKPDEYAHLGKALLVPPTSEPEAEAEESDYEIADILEKLRSDAGG